MAAELPRLLVRAPKAGNATLAAWWATHPLGLTAPEKEVGCLDQRHDRGEDRVPHPVRGEGVRIRRLRCDAAEPDARMWSHWCYFVSLGIERRPFEDVVDDAERGSRVTSFDDAAFSRHVTAPHRVVERFPREQLLVLLTAELRADRQDVMARAAVHAGVEPGALPEIPDQNEGRFPRSVRASTLRARCARTTGRSALGVPPRRKRPPGRTAAARRASSRPAARVVPRRPRRLERPLPAGWHA